MQKKKDLSSSFAEVTDNICSSGCQNGATGENWKGLLWSQQTRLRNACVQKAGESCKTVVTLKREMNLLCQPQSFLLLLYHQLIYNGNRGGRKEGQLPCLLHYWIQKSGSGQGSPKKVQEIEGMDGERSWEINIYLFRSSSNCIFQRISLDPSKSLLLQYILQWKE